MKTPIAIKPNKIRWFLYFFLFLFLSWATVFLYNSTPHLFLDQTIIGVGLCSLTAICLIIMLMFVPFWKASLILNKDGIYINNITRQKRRLIPWEDIKSIGLFHQVIPLLSYPYIQKQNYLVIYHKSSLGDFSNESSGFLFSKSRNEEIKEGKQIIVSAIYLPSSKIEKVLEMFKDFPVKITK